MKITLNYVQGGLRIIRYKEKIIITDNEVTCIRSIDKASDDGSFNYKILNDYTDGLITLGIKQSLSLERLKKIYDDDIREYSYVVKLKEKDQLLLNCIKETLFEYSLHRCECCDGDSLKVKIEDEDDNYSFILIPCCLIDELQPLYELFKMLLGGLPTFIDELVYMKEE